MQDRLGSRLESAPAFQRHTRLLYQHISTLFIVKPSKLSSLSLLRACCHTTHLGTMLYPLCCYHCSSSSKIPNSQLWMLSISFLGGNIFHQHSPPLYCALVSSDKVKAEMLNIVTTDNWSSEETRQTQLKAQKEQTNKPWFKTLVLFWFKL